MEDIQKLRNCLLRVQKEAYNNLKKNFLLSIWVSLGETTLTLLQVFNRRRPEEIERILISDFNNCERIDKSIEAFNGLTKEKQEQAQKYIRFCICGKLGRTVPIILDEFEMHSNIFAVKNQSKSTFKKSLLIWYSRTR